MPRKPRDRRSVVLPLAAGLTLSVGAAACSGKATVTENPPPPEPATEPVALPTGADPAGVGPDAPEPFVYSNPPSPGTEQPPRPVLPSWEEVGSGHPQGATNPPIPFLMVMEDGSRCWKGWSDPRRIDREILSKGGRVITDLALTEGATEIACPDKATEVLAKHAAASSEGGE